MLDIVPVSLKEANAFVERYHRHHYIDSYTYEIVRSETKNDA